MAVPGSKSIEEILKALQGTGAAQAASSTPTQQTGVPAYPPPPSAGQPYSMPPGMPQYGQAGSPPFPTSSYPPVPPAYPPAPAPGVTPATSGFDLNALQSLGQGPVGLEAAIEKAKAAAAAASAYDGSAPAPYGGGGYGRSRSRSPRRDPYRDNYNAYRDERRDMSRDYGRGARDRSYSPGPRGRGSGTFSPRASNGNARERSPLGGEDGSEIIQIESNLVGLIIGRQGENLRRVESETGCRVQFLTPPGDASPYRQCKVTGPRARRAEAKASINRIIDDSGMGALARAGLDKNGPGRDNRGPKSLRENEDSMQIMVPDRTVGLIIGRGGETIRDLQERSGCHINIVGESKSVNGLRPVNLIGSSDSTVRAKDLIMEIVESDTRNPGGSGNGNGSGSGSGSGIASAGMRDRGTRHHDSGGHRGDMGNEKTNDSIYVPSEAVGMIIGKGGETIREMQNMTGCKINVSPSSGPGEVEREIGLVGTRDSIAKAKQAIEDKVETVMQRIKGGPPERGGGRRHNNRHDDYDRPRNDYGRNDRDDSQSAAPPLGGAPPPAGGGADPYAIYGGYQNYVALWYQALAAQAQNTGGAAPQPPPAPGA